MSTYEVIPTEAFQKAAKHYKKKYKRFTDDLKEVVSELENGNLVGDELDNLSLPDDESVYKVRIANTSAGKGKSGGFRLLYYVVKNDSEIFLLTVFSKSDQENIPDDEIRDLIRKYVA